MIGRILHLAAAALIAATCAPPPTVGAPQTAAAPATFDTRDAPRFGDPTASLAAYLARRKPRVAGPQHVCVIGYEGSDDDARAWVHWREGRRLILWEGTDPDAPRGDTLGFGRRDLSLDRDTVASGAEIDGSSYRVTREWANRTIADCGRHGARYTIRIAPVPLRRR